MNKYLEQQVRLMKWLGREQIDYSVAINREENQNCFWIDMTDRIRCDKSGFTWNPREKPEDLNKLISVFLDKGYRLYMDGFEDEHTQQFCYDVTIWHKTWDTLVDNKTGRSCMGRSTHYARAVLNAMERVAIREE